MKHRRVNSNGQVFKVYKKEDQTKEDQFIYQFIFDLYKNMVERCKAFKDFNNSYCYPYTFGERQLDSIFLPALADLCHGKVLTEYPVNRVVKHVDGNEESTGRVDYLCVYKGRTFFIELKHDHDAFRSGVTSDRTKNRWDVMVDYQLRSLKESQYDGSSDSSKAIIRLGLQFITSTAHMEPTDELIQQFYDNLDDIIERLRVDLCRRAKKREPDLIICWKIPYDMVIDCSNGTYPAMTLFAKYKYVSLE